VYQNNIFFATSVTDALKKWLYSIILYCRDYN